MKNLVQVLCVSLSLAMAAPAFAQSFDFGPGGRGPGGGGGGGRPGGGGDGGGQRPGGGGGGQRPGNPGGGGGGGQRPGNPGGGGGGGQRPGNPGGGGGGGQRPGPGFPQPGPRPGPRPGPGFPHPGPGPGFPRPGPGPGFPRPGPGPGFPRPGPGYPQPSQPQDGYYNVFRFVGGADHLLTLDQNEGFNAGYQYEGVAFSSFTDAYGQSGPRSQLFRCATYNDHFASTDPNCEGQRREGSLGFINARPGYDANRALVRCFNGNSHLVTADANECYNAGYRVEFTLGFVL